jgi:hypothetical protein
VYAARGNHSPYPSAGSHEVTIRQGGRSYDIKDDAPSVCPKCPQWRTWNDVIAARTQPWYGYGGAWGYADYSVRVGGSRGPSPHPR